MIDDPRVLKFVNESIRTTADRLTELLPVPAVALDAALGTTSAELLRAEPWEPATTPRRERHRVSRSRRQRADTGDELRRGGALVAVRQMIEANADLVALARKIVVPPRLNSMA